MDFKKKKMKFVIYLYICYAFVKAGSLSFEIPKRAETFFLLNMNVFNPVKYISSHNRVTQKSAIRASQCLPSLSFWDWLLQKFWSFLPKDNLSQKPSRCIWRFRNLPWCCETVFTIHINLLARENKSLSSAFWPSLFFPIFPFNFLLFICHSHCLPLFLAPCVYSAFLWKTMIHWLWSLWAVSLKSVFLLSVATEWYITYIPCNFLVFIRCI